jgi:hypothetical protein
MCPSRARCDRVDCCFSELELYNCTNRPSSSSHRNVTCSRHEIAEELSFKSQHLKGTPHIAEVSSSCTRYRKSTIAPPSGGKRIWRKHARTTENKLDSCKIINWCYQCRTIVRTIEYFKESAVVSFALVYLNFNNLLLFLHENMLLIFVVLVGITCWTF